MRENNMSKLNLSRDYIDMCEIKSNNQPEKIYAKNKKFASNTSIINYTYTYSIVYSNWLKF
jgi:hypothetical protein